MNDTPFGEILEQIREINSKIGVDCGNVRMQQ
jgi:hypothetical protein